MSNKLQLATCNLGEVIEVSRSQVIVAFTANDDSGDLCVLPYRHEHFLRVPKKGDQVVVYTQMFTVPTQRTPAKPRKPRKNVVPLPRTF